MRESVIGLFCLFFLILPAAADDWEAAAAAYDAGRYQEAVDLMEPLAEGGLIKAQLLLGQTYLLGMGVVVDEERAVHWYGLAANQYDPTALFNLAMLTLNGKGTKADPAAAIDLLYAAATFEEPNALFELGRIYLTGAYSEPIDVDLGLQFLAWAAQSGHRGASAMLAIVIQEIPEIDQYLIKSALHFQVAIDRGCDDLDKAAAQAVSRLSSDERALYEHNLPATLAQGRRDAAGMQAKGHCLAG